MKKKTILIVGGAGFIGSHVANMLRQADYHTVVYDNLSRSTRSTFADNPFIQGDIGDAQALDTLFTHHPIDAVMHFAAFIDVGESVRDPALYYYNNVCGTLTLLNAMVRHHVKTLIFSSTAAVYGMPQSAAIDETHPCNPINPYGRSKWMVEQILRDYDQAYGLKSCSFRYFNAAGGDPEGQIKSTQPHITNLIPLILKSLKTGGKVTLFGTDYPTPDGTCIRDYIHIDDLGRAHILGMKKLLNGSPSCFYNLGNGQGHSVREVIRAAEHATGMPVLVQEGGRRPGDPPILVANARKAMKELDWQPRYQNLETMIEHAWKAWEQVVLK